MGLKVIGCSLAILVAACDSYLPRAWRATPAAGFRRMAAARLTSCTENNLCIHKPQCLAESAVYCVDAGYEPECGQMEPETTCGINLR